MLLLIQKSLTHLETMASRKINFFIKFFQCTLVLPFNYNTLKGKFQKSQKLEKCAKFVYITTLIIVVNSVRVFFFYSKIFSYMDSLDKYLMKLSWITFILFYFAVAHEYCFKLPELMNLINRVLDIHQKYKYYRVSKKNQYVFIEKYLEFCAIEMILLPIVKFIIDLMYFVIHGRLIYFIRSCISLMFIMVWIFWTLRLFFLTIKYFTFLIKNMNQEIMDMGARRHTRDDIVRIAEIHVVYSQLMDVIQKMLHLHQLQFLCYIFGATNNFFWQLYTGIDLVFLHITSYQSLGYVQVLFFWLYAVYSQFQLVFFVNLVDSILMEQNKTVHSIHAFQTKIVDDEFKNKVIIIIRFFL